MAKELNSTMRCQGSGGLNWRYLRWILLVLILILVITMLNAPMKSSTSDTKSMGDLDLGYKRLKSLYNKHVTGLHASPINIFSWDTYAKVLPNHTIYKCIETNMKVSIWLYRQV